MTLAEENAALGVLNEWATDLMVKSRPGGDFMTGKDDRAGREREIASIRKGLEALQKAHLGGQIDQDSYAALRQGAMARLEQLGAVEDEAEAMTKSILTGLHFGTMAPSRAAQAALVSGNLAGRVSPGYLRDWMGLGR